MGLVVMAGDSAAAYESKKHGNRVLIEYRSAVREALQGVGFFDASSNKRVNLEIRVIEARYVSGESGNGFATRIEYMLRDNSGDLFSVEIASNTRELGGFRWRNDPDAEARVMQANLKLFLLNLRCWMDPGFIYQANTIAQKVNEEAETRSVLSKIRDGAGKVMLAPVLGVGYAAVGTGKAAMALGEAVGTEGFASIASTVERQNERDLRMQTEMSAGLASAQAAGEAEWRRRQEAQAVVSPPGSAATTGYVQAGIQPKSDDASSVGVQDSLLLAGTGTESSRLRPAEAIDAGRVSSQSSASPPRYTSPPPKASEEDCSFERVERDIRSFWEKDRARAEAWLDKEAYRVCNMFVDQSLGPHSLTEQGCESGNITRPEISDGKITIQVVGTQWECRAHVSCAKPKRTCRSTSGPSGASVQ